MTQLQVGFQLHQGSARDADEIQEIFRSLASLAFGEIGWNGDGRPTDLAGHAEQLFLREPRRRLIALHSQSHPFLRIISKCSKI